MKKLKRILPILFVFVMSLAVAIATACSSCNNDEPGNGDGDNSGTGNENTKVLDSIELDTADASTIYFAGSTFSAAGVKVITHYTDSAAYPDETLAIDARGVSVDSSAFKSNVEGSYDITVSYTLDEVTKSSSYSVSVIGEASIMGIRIDTTDAKTTFVTTEAFSSEGLKVYAIIDDGDGEREILCPDTDLEINSRQYKQQAGTYTINVAFFTDGDIYFEGTYEVEVIEGRAGVDVKLKDGVEQYITVTENGADLSDYANWIEVRVPDMFGNVDENSAPLASSEYTVSLWLAQEKIDDVTALGKGAYQIVVNYQGHESFVLIYVDDSIVGISLKEEGAVTEQGQSQTDKMTSTWNFIATYGSGNKETLSASKVTISGVSTVMVGTRTANVSYTFTNFSGESKTVGCTVDYTITPSSEAMTFNYTYKASELKEAIEKRIGGELTDGTKLNATDFNTTSNSFVTFIGSGEEGSDQARGSGASLTSFEIKGGKLQVTFMGKGSITVGFGSTGGSNTSALGLVAEDGTVITADANNVLVADNGDAKAGFATVTGTGETKATFEITQAGTYTITAIYPSGGDSTRGARIYSITMEDNLGPADGSVTEKNNYNASELSAAVKARVDADEALTWADNLKLTAADFNTKSNSFLTFIGSGDEATDQIRLKDNAFSHIEIMGGKLQVTFKGTGTLTVGFSSTGSSNTSAIGLLDADGNVVKITEAGSATILEADDGDAKAGFATVAGTKEVNVTFEITEAGTYTITSIYPTGKEDPAVRGARIYSISMTDKYVPDTAEGGEQTASVNETALLAIVDDRRDA